MNVDRCPECGQPMVRGGLCLHCSRASAPSPATAHPDSTRSRFAVTSGAIITALLGIGLFRIAVAVWEIRHALAAGPGAPALIAAIAGVLSVVVGGYALSVIRSVIRRHHHATGQLVLICAVSVAWGVWAILVMGVEVELIGVALGGLLGILTWKNSGRFDYGAGSRDESPYS